jgi:hypothetical protein
MRGLVPPDATSLRVDPGAELFHRKTLVQDLYLLLTLLASCSKYSSTSCILVTVEAVKPRAASHLQWQ